MYVRNVIESLLYLQIGIIETKILNVLIVLMSIMSMMTMTNLLKSILRLFDFRKLKVLDVIQAETEEEADEIFKKRHGFGSR